MTVRTSAAQGDGRTMSAAPLQACRAAQPSRIPLPAAHPPTCSVHAHAKRHRGRHHIQPPRPPLCQHPAAHGVWQAGMVGGGSEATAQQRRRHAVCVLSAVAVDDGAGAAPLRPPRRLRWGGAAACAAPRALQHGQDVWQGRGEKLVAAVAHGVQVAHCMREGSEDGGRGGAGVRRSRRLTFDRRGQHGIRAALA